MHANTPITYVTGNFTDCVINTTHTQSNTRNIDFDLPHINVLTPSILFNLSLSSYYICVSIMYTAGSSGDPYEKYMMSMSRSWPPSLNYGSAQQVCVCVCILAGRKTEDPDRFPVCIWSSNSIYLLSLLFSSQTIQDIRSAQIFLTLISPFLLPTQFQ